MQAALVVGLLALLLSPAPAARAEEERSRIGLAIRYPASGAVVDPAESALLVGDAFVDHEAAGALDVAVLVDVSTSTGLFAGGDVDGDGVEDERSFAGPDSVLAAERRAIGRVLETVAGGGRRVALVRFSARPTEWWREEAPARTVQALTADAGPLQEALAAVAAERPRGMTDLAAALREGLRALGDGADGRDRVLLLFTDGSPTHPHESPEENVRATLEAARECAAKGVRVHTFAVGMKALANPSALIRVAEETRGFFTPVAEPADLAEIASWVARSTLRDVRVRNLTTGARASRTRMGHDSSWSALVPLREGRNRIQVVASAAGHAPSRLRIVLLGRAGTEPQAPPEALGGHRELLLEDRLARLRERVEGLRERLREDLVREMDRVRAQKQLELRAEDASRP